MNEKAEIIYGLSGSGKTSHCRQLLLDAANRDDINSIFFIIPDPSSHNAEKEIIEYIQNNNTTPGLLINKKIEVLSFKRLFYYVASNVGGLNLEPIGNTGKTLILRRIAQQLGNSLKIMGVCCKHLGFADILTNSISEFKQYNITPTDIINCCDKMDDTNLLKLKLQDLGLIYEKYENTINGQFSDTEDELLILLRLIRENPLMFDKSLFIFDDFSGFTPLEYSVIHEILTQTKNSYFTLTSDTCDYSNTDDTDAFYITKKTMKRLYEIASEANIPVSFYEIKKDITNIRREFSHLEQYLITRKKKIYNGDTDSISLTIADNLYTEIEHIATQIHKLTRCVNNETLRYKYRDIAVVTRDVERYSYIIGKIFGACDIPFFMDTKTNAAQQSASLTIISALDIFINNWSYESVFAYLKSGFANISADELYLIENYIIATGIRGSSWISEKAWHYTPYMAKDFENFDDFLSEINRIRSLITTPLKNMFNSLKLASSAGEMCRSLYEYIRVMDIYNKIDNLITLFRDVYSDFETAARLGQFWNILIKILDEINTVCGAEKISIAEFRGMLFTGLSTHDIGIIPPTLDNVIITDVSRSKPSKIPIVFVIGFNDKLFPLISTEEGILNDSDRVMLNENDYLELAQTTTEKAFDEDFIIYSLFTSPVDKLFISYSIANVKGEALFPSSLISSIKSIFPNMHEDNLISREGITLSHPSITFPKLIGEMAKGKNNDYLLKTIGEWYLGSPIWSDKYTVALSCLNYKNSSGNISDNILDELYCENLTTTISRLEAFSKCPFSHFVRYILKAEPRKEAILESTDVGSIIHKIIEILSTRVDTEFGSWKNANEEWIATQIPLIVDDLIKEIEEKLDYKSNRRYWLFMRLRQTAIACVTMLAEHLTRSEFTPLGYEIEFSDKGKYTPLTIDLGGKLVKIRGVIDRADIYIDQNGRKFIRIIDYKTYSHNFSISDIYYGLQLQLVVYLDRLCDIEGADPAGMLYFRLHDPIVSAQEEGDIEGARNIEYKMTGLLLSDTDVLNKMDERLEIGEPSLLPVSYKKDGEPRDSSSVAGYEQFKAMRKKVKKVVSDISRDIIKGKTTISPVKMSAFSSCTYCEYSDICLFDVSCNDRYRNINPLSKDEAWGKIMEEVRENGVD